MSRKVRCQWVQSRYNIAVPYRDKTAILYNTLYGSLAVVNSATYAAYKALRTLRHGVCSEGTVSFLRSNRFIVPHGTDEMELLRRGFRADSGRLAIGVELTRQCNLTCSYCYQNHTPRHLCSKGISMRTLGQVLQYIQCVITRNYRHIDRVSLLLIGGEPLLEKSKLVYLVKHVHDLCFRLQKELSVGIDTNGTLLDSRFGWSLLACCKRTSLSVSLTTPEHHNKTRTYAGGRGTYEQIVARLKQMKPVFEAGMRLEIRHNTDHDNVDSLPDFIVGLRNDPSFPRFAVNAVRTEEYEYNPAYVNRLTAAEFARHNTELQRTLIDNDMEVTHFPSCWLTRCKAYESYCCKVFADGRIGLCDYWKDGENVRIADIAEEPDRLLRAFSQYKYFSPFQVPTCARCSKLPLCGGMWICKGHKQCEYENLDIRRFLALVVEAIEQGKGHLFAMRRPMQYNRQFVM